MRSERSEIKAKGGRARSLAGSNRGFARKSALRRLLHEDLEQRALLASLPGSLLTPTIPVTLPQPLVVTPTPLVISRGLRSTDDASTPTIAVDKNNPQKLAAVWTLNDPQNPGNQKVFVQGAVSSNGGVTWTLIPGLNPNFNLLDPTTSNPVLPYAQATDASVAFDRNDNFYVLMRESQGSSSSGAANALVLYKYDFTGGTPNAVFTSRKLYESQQDEALLPTLAVDDNVASFTDIDATGKSYTQTDPYTGNVYIAFSTNDTPPSPNPPPNFNPNRILMISSSDGGQNFSGPVVMNVSGSNTALPQRFTAPRLAISQGRPKNTAVYGAGDLGVPGGQVTLVYQDFNTNANANPPNTIIRAVNFAGGVSVVANGGGGGIPDNDTVTGLQSTVNVAINNPSFTTLSDVSVSVNIAHQAVNSLTITLIAPGGQSFTLTSAGQQPSGTNFGINNTSGVSFATVFTDAGARSIANQGSSAPYTGTYRPTGGSLRNFLSGATPAQLNGTWTLKVTDNAMGTVGNLNNWSLNLLSGQRPLQDNIVTTTTVMGAMTDPYPFATQITSKGIGPGATIASDNTLGAYSPYQGRLYVAFVDRLRTNNNINPADNSDIFLLVSDDSGRTWGPPARPGGVTNNTGARFQVNDDLANRDGFSEGDPSLEGRPQLQPEVQVDVATGSLVMSWLDARNDAARARVATYVGASSDGGQNFSPQVFANQAQTAVDAVTGKTVILGPIPDNQSGGNGNSEGNFAFGTHQGLAIYGGKIYTVWSSNENSVSNLQGMERLDIRTSRLTIAAGPRIIDSTMGPVGLPGDFVNPTSQTPTVGAFQVQFDRPVDPSSFLPDSAKVFFRDAVAGNSTEMKVLSVQPVPVFDPNNPNNRFGFTVFQVNFVKQDMTPATGVGTYSYFITPDIHDRIRKNTIALTPSGPEQHFDSPDVPKPIPDLTTTTSTTTVSAFQPNEVVANVKVNVTLTHTFDADLTITLISPIGTRITLSSGHGGSGQDYLGTTFSDAAPTPIASGTAPFSGTFRPDQQLLLLNAQPINGDWKLEVQDNFGGNSGNLVSWSLDLTPGIVGAVPSSGNKMDQDTDANVGEQPQSFVGPGDAYAAPRPTNNGGNFVWPAGEFFGGPYSQDTLPLILPGPHLVGSHVPGAPATSDNLVLNGTVNSIDVTFDRDMDPASFTPASILRIFGPAGQINGPFTVQANPLNTDPNPAAPRTYRIGFPTQTLSGTYTITLASTIKSAAGDQLDTNLNAGLDLLKQTVSGNTTPVTYNSTNVPAAITPQKTVSSTLTIPDSYPVRGATLTLTINYPFDPDLEAVLIAPDGTTVKLFTNVGTTGTQANFSNTTFDDTAATPIQNGGPPFFGRFSPQIPFSTFETNNVNVGGTWTLQIKDDAAANTNRTGSLVSWSLTFLKPVPITGLGELVADQAPVSFRIFTTDPTNPQAHNTWTPIGPTSLTNEGGAFFPSVPSSQGYAGQVGAIAVDPSDPSGNTVYVAGASGGIWKTTNFLTTSSLGPTYVPLTDFGPTFGMNIGSIAVFGRNNDPHQSIIIAGTGFADSSPANGNTVGGNTSQGVGFLRSMDGGATWTLLDSTNNNLPFSPQPGSQAQRDHLFAAVDPATGLGTSTYKVIVDPRPAIDGNVIVYAALSGANGGFWRSLDTGQTWQKLSNDAVHGKTATDIVFNLNSAVPNAVNPAGNVNVLYVAFQNGSAGGVYVSPNRGQTLNRMAGGGFDPFIVDPAFVPPSPITVGNGGTFPTSTGRIVLAKPALVSSNPIDPRNVIYEGWVYAAVAAPDGSFDGLYLTKDNGATWTKLKTPYVPENGFRVAVPSNDPNKPDYTPTTARGLPNSSNYNMTLAIDPTNANIVYLGGSSVGEDSGLIRIDATRVYDSHADVAYDGSRPDGGTLQINTAGRAQVKVVTNGLPVLTTLRGSFISTSTTTKFLSLIQDPNNPFLANTTLLLSNVNSTASGGTGFTNDGSGVLWTPFDRLLAGGPNDAFPSTGLHRVISMVDPLTGHARLIFAGDQGVFTGVDNNGELDLGISTADAPANSRNGNLQISQFFYGAAQPSNIGAQVAQALAYGNGLHTSIGESDPSVLTNGNLTWTDPSNFYIGELAGEVSGVGVQTDQQNRGIVYQYVYPGLGGAFTDFFQVSLNGGTFTSRTTGLVQAVNDPQWPTGSAFYANGLVQGNFTVNPIAGDQVIISSNAGRVFSTIDQGRNWLVIANPTDLDSSYAPALAYGAPDPNAPGGIGNLNNFIYAGTVGGKIFVTTTGGGTVAGGNGWTDISSGLDGSPVMKIVTNPTRGDHEAYAVTQKGVYHTANSLAAVGTGTVWTPITGNLFSILNPAFGNAAQSTPQTRYLTSLAVDWRYVIPDNPTQANSPTHPVLYASGEAGVYRSLDDGQTWALFPNIAFDAAPKDGGMLPVVHVTDLNLSLGRIDPTTGRAEAQPGDPNILTATTLGRGTFSIRLAPVVFPNTAQAPNNIRLDPSTQSGSNAAGIPLVSPNTSRPIINGFSEQTAFGNKVLITFRDVTDPANPKVIGGFDPANPVATNIAANQTDSFGKYSIQVNQAAFTANGLKTIEIQATDASGTTGNIATFQFILQATNLGQPTPPSKPTINLNPVDDSSNGQKRTKITQPRIFGRTDPNTAVALFFSVGGSIPAGATPVSTANSDANGNYILTFPTALPDGPVTVQVRATNTFGSTDSDVLSFTIDTQGPTAAPTLGLLAADDTGVKGDGITSNRRPHFVGQTDPSAIVELFNVANPAVPLATTAADGTGAFSFQLPSDLTNGSITVQARARDIAGNQGPVGNTFTLTVTTVAGDYDADGKADLALFRRTSPQALWLIQNVTPAAGTPFGVGTLDIPLKGDFNGDGRTDLAVYRPSTATWFVQGIFPASGVQWGQALVDIPVPGDYLGTGQTTIALFRPTTGEWFIPNSPSAPPVFGRAGDIPVPGDYDGTGHDGIAVYRPSTGQFFIAGRAQPIQVGGPGLIPVPGKYDSTATFRSTEPAVYDPSTGVMTILGPNNQLRNVQFAVGSVPVPGDYDGVGLDEPAAYDPTTGVWSIFAPGTTTARTVAFAAQSSVPVDAPFSYRKLPVAGDYNADGKADLALFRKGTGQWFIPGITGAAGVSFGSGTKDIPLLGDFNGDGRADLAVYRPSTGTWFVQGVFPGNGVPFGQPNVDLPVPADYFGTGQTTIAVFRPTKGQWFIAGVATPTTLGRQGDTPVPGNYDGSGKAQIAVFRPAAPGNPTQWLILGSNNVVQTIAFGGKTDVPVPGDYDGIGRTQLATYRSGLWFIAGHAQPISFGGSSDIPAPGDYDGIGKTQIAVYRPSTGQLFIAGHAQPITFGGSRDIPVNAPFIYRSLSGKVSATAVTTKGVPLNFGTQAATLSAASVSSPVQTQAAPKPTTPTPANPPVANYGRSRPKQQATTPTNRLRGLELHDDALASYQGGLGRRQP